MHVPRNEAADGYLLLPLLVKICAEAELLSESRGTTAATVQGLTLLDITAQKVSENECTDIVTVEDVNDVSYFTEEIDYMQFRGEINSYDKFFKSLASSGLIINKIQLDYSKSIATLQLLTVTTEDLPVNLEALQGDSGKDGETIYSILACYSEKGLEHLAPGCSTGRHKKLT